MRYQKQDCLDCSLRNYLAEMIWWLIWSLLQANMRPNLQCFERITICKVQKGFNLKNVSFEICRMVPSMIEAFLYLEAGGDFKNIDIKCNHSVGHFKTFFVWLYEKHLKKAKNGFSPFFHGEKLDGFLGKTCGGIKRQYWLVVRSEMQCLVWKKIQNFWCIGFGVWSNICLAFQKLDLAITILRLVLMRQKAHLVG